MRPTKWTDEDIAYLQRQWANGLSAAQIAARLENRFSRNAVIGKITRLRIAGQITDPVIRPKFTPGAYRRRSEGRAAPVVRIRKPTPPRPRKPLLALPVPKPDPSKPTILDVRDGYCKFPYGDSPHIHFCGAQCETDNSSYCNAHRAVVYRAAEPVKKPLPVKRFAA